MIYYYMKFFIITHPYLWHGHEKAEDITSRIIDNLMERSGQVTGNPVKHIYDCRSSIAIKLGAIGSIRNEAEVRFAYTDSIVTV